MYLGPIPGALITINWWRTCAVSETRLASNIEDNQGFKIRTDLPHVKNNNYYLSWRHSVYFALQQNCSMRLTQLSQRAP